jgi:signal transduction histidine kinase/ligand-binding sensor domain-containing protein
MQRVRTIAAWVASAAWILMGAHPCAASEADAFAGYTRHVWQASDGLPEQTVQAFAQTRDGYLWIGTSGGLVRFDGVHFTVFDRQNTPALHENSIFCLTVSRDGALWIGTEGGGIVRMMDGRFQSWTTKEGLSNDFVRTVFEDASGTVWAGTDNGLMQYSQGRFVRVDGTAAIPELSVHAIYQDRAGRLWAGGYRLTCIEHMTARMYSLGTGFGQNMVKSITQTRDGTMWVGTVAGLESMPPGQDHFRPVKGIASTVRALRQTGDGVLWIGTIGQGVFLLHDGAFTHVLAPANLPSNTVLRFFEDSEHNFWIGTQAGMLRLTQSPVSIVAFPTPSDSDFGTIYQGRDGSFWAASAQLFQLKDGAFVPEKFPGVSDIHVRNVFQDRSGALWVGTDGNGLFRIAGGQAEHFTTLNTFIRAIAQAHDGSMWVGTDGGLNHIVAEGGKQTIRQYFVGNGLIYPSIRVLTIDHTGDLWVGTDRGINHVRGDAFLNDPAIAPLAQMKVWAIHEDSDGGLWFGTRDNGLYRLREGKLTHFTAEDGLASNAIYQILEDASGHLWLSGPNGVALVNRHELDAQAELFPRHFALTFYSTADMAANTEIYGGTQSSGCITPQGDVWFPSNLGPLHIPPLGRTALPPPPLFIQGVRADGRPAAADGEVVLRPGNGRLEFDFTPVQLRSQDGLRFRYMLEGFEKAWSAPTAERTADYTNLPAGRYRFRVQTFDVSNPNAVSEASIAIVQRPFFYRTWWFMAGCAVLITLLVFGLYQYRVRQVRVRFEAVLEERSRLAREMHDTVIQGCTGVSALLEALAMEGEKDSRGAGLMEFARLQLRGTINEAREAIWNLRKPDDAGSLGEKLESMTHQVSSEFQVPVAWSMSGTPFTVTEPVAHDLLMVAREAVYNAMLHGHPARVQVALKYKSSELVLDLDDDGCGFDPQQADRENGHHFGLKGMKERVERSGGKFHLASAPGKGVRIEVRVPRRTGTRD